MLGKPRILFLFRNLFNKFNKTSTHVRSSMAKKLILYLMSATLLAVCSSFEKKMPKGVPL